MNSYAGWNICYLPEGSQHWVATKRGVSIRARSESDLLKMIDRREN